MTKIYECSKCGVITETPDQLCTPQRLENMGVYCDASGDTQSMCAEMKSQVAFVCDRCGRPSEQAEMVCEPSVVG